MAKARKQVPRAASRGVPTSWVPSANEALNRARVTVKSASSYVALSRQQVELLASKKYRDPDMLDPSDRGANDRLVLKGFLKYDANGRLHLTKYGRYQCRCMVLSGCMPNDTSATTATDGAVIPPVLTGHERQHPTTDVISLKLTWLSTRAWPYCAKIPVNAIRMLSTHTYRRPDRLTSYQLQTFRWLCTRGYLVYEEGDDTADPVLSEFGDLQRKCLVLSEHIIETPDGNRVY